LNIFELQSDFITRDPRTSEAIDRAFTPETQLARFEAWVPSKYLKDKSVLDLGCCLAAFGGYALSYGAKSYVGVEISKPLANIAQENLNKYHAGKDWKIIVDSCEHYLDNNLEQFDFILAGGILHGITNFIPVLNNLAASGKIVIIESVHPPMSFVVNLIEEIGKLKGEESYERLQKLLLDLEYIYSTVSYSDTGKMMHHDNREAVKNILRILPSMGALKIIMNRLGFIADVRGYNTLKQSYPDHYGFGKRFLMAFLRKNQPKPMSYSELIDSDYKEIQKWQDKNAKGTI
jgi:SAM-dependent methyltransferase